MRCNTARTLFLLLGFEILSLLYLISLKDDSSSSSRQNDSFHAWSKWAFKRTNESFSPSSKLRATFPNQYLYDESALYDPVFNISAESKRDSSWFTLTSNRSHLKTALLLAVKSKTQSKSEVIPLYNQSDITRLCRARSELLHLLIFDGNEFRIVGMHERPRFCGCQKHFVALVIDALLTARPNRFTTGSLPFQIVLSILSDHVYYPCVDDVVSGGCSQHNFPPLLTPTSVPKDSSVAQFIKQFPIGDYNKCLYDWRQHAQSKCLLEHLLDHRDTSQAWDTLQPQLFWRGTDFGFILARNLKRHCSDVLPQTEKNCGLSTRQAADVLLSNPNLFPRCKAVAMTLDTEASMTDVDNYNRTIGNALRQTWINVKFAEHNLGSRWTNCRHSLFSQYVSRSEMAKFKYQIDFAGIGGTTWLGTITKLAMPGLLFHHETHTKDWFHDDIKPWEHYVPINSNLSDLHEKFKWAESHQLLAKRIAQRAQDFARERVTRHRYQTTFQGLYVNRLGRIADAYLSAPNETLQSILQEYKADKLVVTILGTCNATGCVVQPEYLQ